MNTLTHANAKICACGRDVYYTATGRCKRCYVRDWKRKERRRLGAPEVACCQRHAELQPCADCGTLDGRIPRKMHRPVRIRGRCWKCYRNWQYAQERIRRQAPADASRATGPAGPRGADPTPAEIAQRAAVVRAERLNRIGREPAAPVRVYRYLGPRTKRGVVAL